MNGFLWERKPNSEFRARRAGSQAMNPVKVLLEDRLGSVQAIGAVPIWTSELPGSVLYASCSTYWKYLLIPVKLDSCVIPSFQI